MHRWLIWGQFREARRGANHWKWLHIYTRRRFAMPDQVAKSHSPGVTEHDRDDCDWLKFSVVTGIYCMSSRIYPIFGCCWQSFWMAFGYLARHCKPSCISIYIWSHFQWFAPLLAYWNWPQISHLWFVAIMHWAFSQTWKYFVIFTPLTFI